MKHILCGNPNSGKTTFLNSLTQSNEHVGNWHGVTVDFLEKEYQLNGSKNIIVDLPGIYSLTSYSFEEEVARDYIYNSNCPIINIIDSNNLSRNLYLTLQLLEAKKSVMLCLNMANELKKNKIEINYKMLENTLKTNVISINAQKKEEVKRVVESDFKNNFLPSYFNSLPIKEVKDIIKSNINNLSLDADFVCVKVLEEDDYVIEKLQLTKEQKQKLNQFDLKEKIISLRYEFIDKLIAKCVTQKRDFPYGYSKLDKVILNRFFALPIFVIIISLIFFITFSSVGLAISSFLTNFFDKCINIPLLNLLTKITGSNFILSFIENGILAVFTTLIGFLPQIVLLFLFLAILEDTGYLSRLAFTFEDIFSKVGLNGKSVFTLLMGFGCNTTSALTSRTHEDKNSKIKATMLSSYMSCTAKIPLYSVIVGAFFNNNIFIIIFLYFLGVLVALLLSLLLEKTLLKSKEASFIMEMPAYRFISAKRVGKTLIFNVKDFVLRVGGTLLIFSILIWFLQSFTINFTFITDASSQQSLLLFLGEILAPFFAPLGFNGGGVCACLICGIVAKEIIVSSMALINNVSIDGTIQNLSNSLLNKSSAICFSPISAFCFLVFSLLYLPCISTISVYASEMGKKWTFLAILIQFSIAYIITFIFNNLLVLFNGLNFMSIFVSLLIFVVIIFALIKTVKLIKKPKLICANCKKCNKCKK